ncbi:MAG: c-type cytochrome [Alphaproteobacteria bacterium]|nr:c-type cytochrome [Alphaproteobacteria bacterium]
MLVWPALADAARGRDLYESRCIACHSIEANRVGPMHRGVVGRKAGSVAGFAYSQAVHNSNVVWTRENLDRWLTNPQAVIAGQRMNFRVANAQDRWDIIDFLSEQSAR